VVSICFVVFSCSQVSHSVAHFESRHPVESTSVECCFVAVRWWHSSFAEGAEKEGNRGEEGAEGRKERKQKAGNRRRHRLTLTAPPFSVQTQHRHTHSLTPHTHHNTALFVPLLVLLHSSSSSSSSSPPLLLLLLFFFFSSSSSPPPLLLENIKAVSHSLHLGLASPTFSTTTATTLSLTLSHSLSHHSLSLPP